MSKRITTPAPSGATGILATNRKAAAAAVREAMQLYGRTVVAAWHAGELLIGVKADLPHGGFGPWLASERIAETTAREFMRLRQHVSRDELNGTVSIRAALETVKAKRRRAAVLDAEERQLVELDMLRAQVAEMEKRAVELEAEHARLEARCVELDANAKARLTPEGYRQLQDELRLLSERQATIRELDRTVKAKDAEVAKLQRQQQDLKRAIRKAERARRAS